MATYREQLYDVAVGKYGYVTAADAHRLDIPVVELGKLAHRGKLDRISYGVYRFPKFPRTERDEYMEAVLWVGEDAVLSHDAVLALHDLAFVNPRKIRVTTPRRVRKTHPREDIEIIRNEVPNKDLTTYFKIPSTTVARALLDCRELVMRQRLEEAAQEARRRGLLLTHEYEDVRSYQERPT